MDIWNLVAERKIREAMEEGQLDHLEGAGAPLDLDENPFEDRSLRMAHRLLKNNGFAPDWILESKDIDQEIGRLKADRAHLAPAEYQQRLDSLNRRILRYNLTVPVLSLQKTPC